MPPMYYGPHDKLCSPSVLTEKEEMQKHLKTYRSGKKKKKNHISLCHSYDSTEEKKKEKDVPVVFLNMVCLSQS